MDINIEIAEIINSIIWPLLIAILLFKYREHLGSFLKGISSRINKLSFGIVSIELAETKGVEPEWVYNKIDIRQNVISNFASENIDLFREIIQPIPADYAIFDIGDGNQWLTSRLFLFTIMLHRMRALKRIVFVDTCQEISRHFVGISEPVHVIFALSNKYPWLEKAFVEEFTKLDLQITSMNGRMKESEAEMLIENFSTNPSIRKDIPPQGEEDKWIKIGNNSWEHAERISTNKLKDILKNVLDRSWISETNLKGRSNKEQIINILDTKKSFVVIVEEDTRFEKLIDRENLTQEVLEQVLKEYL